MRNDFQLSLSLQGRIGGGAHALATSHYPLSTSPSRRSRHAFTLIELMVAIAIIGILAAIMLGGMWRADVAAKRTNSKTTVIKVAAQLQEIWDSYRTRKLPINPQLILQASSGVAGSPYYPQWCAATGNGGLSPGWLPYYNTVRTTIGASTLNPTAPSPLNNLQVAAIRLAATHELMRLEMPCQFTDFTSSPSGTTPANAAPVQTLLIPQPFNASGPLANPGGLSEKYRQFFKANATAYNDSYQSAECLYMIIKFASQNELGQKSITDDPRLVGDADGDGMPEIQDSFNCGTFTPAAPSAQFPQHNMPIAFIRWPVGYLSDLQPGPTTNTGTWTDTTEYAAKSHEIFDPLRIDPRAFTTKPLIFSAGATGSMSSPYSDYDIWEGHSYAGLTASQKLFAQNDPYYTKSLTPIFPLSGNASLEPLPGTQMDPGTSWVGGQLGLGNYVDNITNHLLNTRSQ